MTGDFQCFDIAIITGRGRLPFEFVNGLKVKQLRPFLIGIEGEYEDWIKQHDHEILGWGQFGRLFRLLKEKQISKIVFAGSVNRPRIDISKMDWVAIKTLPQIFAFMLGGDNTVLTGVSRVFEKHGISVIGAQEVLPELLSEPGMIVGRKPSKKALVNISKAVEACKLLGQLDIGQAAIAVGGRVVALEGIEGTDNMIKRGSELRAIGRLKENGRQGVLVKTAKPGQDLRMDLPTIGPKTIELIDEAGLAGVAIQAGYSFILSREDTMNTAKQRGLFIMGLESP